MTRKLLGLAILALSVSGCATLKHLLFTYDPLNLHIVTPELIRSGQPRQGDLTRIVEEFGIRSVINLRGERPGQDWYDDEVAEAKELELAHVDIGMSARRLPHREDLVALLDGFRDLPRPILVHCEAGADRTGEVVAISLLNQGKSKKQALGALHPRYGHFIERFPAKVYFVRDVYVDEDWAREIYDPCEQDYQYYDQEEFCSNRFLPRAGEGSE